MNDLKHEKPYIITGKLIGITKTKHNYMDERIFFRGTKVINASNLEIMLDNGEKQTVVFPMIIDYFTGVNIINQDIIYTKNKTKHINTDQGTYNVNKFILEILSGVEKNNTYEKEA